MKRIVLLGILSVIWVCLVSAQDSNLVVGGDEAALRNYIARYMGLEEENGSAVYIGNVPDSFPNIVSFPETSQIAGVISSRHSNDENGLSYSVLLNSSSSPFEIASFFTQTYSINGWQELSQHSDEPTGFSTFFYISGTYCYDDSEQSLSLIYDSSGENGDASIPITISIQIPADPYICNNTEQVIYDSVMQFIPAFEPVAGAILLDGTGPSYLSDGAGFISATLEIEGDLDAVLDGYNRQLEAWGWYLINQESSELAAFSTWQRQEPDYDNRIWSATFSIIQNAGNATQYQVFMFINTIDS